MQLGARAGAGYTHRSRLEHDIQRHGTEDRRFKMELFSFSGFKDRRLGVLLLQRRRSRTQVLRSSKMRGSSKIREGSSKTREGSLKLEDEILRSFGFEAKIASKIAIMSLVEEFLQLRFSAAEDPSIFYRWGRRTEKSPFHLRSSVPKIEEPSVLCA